jgi:hypothetical protein
MNIDGKPTRIDFILATKDGKQYVIVNKLAEMGERAIVLSHEEKSPEFKLQDALAWCKANGWAVREWPTGARAWAGGMARPVRTAAQIKRMRQKISDYIDPSLIHAEGFDLAYDL